MFGTYHPYTILCAHCCSFGVWHLQKPNSDICYTLTVGRHCATITTGFVNLFSRSSIGCVLITCFEGLNMLHFLGGISKKN